MKSIERFTWAIEILSVKPSDKILELGCGTGIVAEMIGSILKDGHLTAIDRSGTMIDKAKKKNSKYIGEKKIIFRTVELAKFHARDQVFDKIFAFNVNLFWTQTEIVAEAKVLRQYLTNGGRLYLFYQPPAEHILKKIAASLRHNFEAEKWKIEKTVFNKKVGSSCFIVKS
jgi:ubiquinone/menaquinone biosynthesis C-methylase UbiE